MELALLSRLAVDVTQTKPTLQLVFRDPATINLVPNYEGQPMIDTLKDQVRSACRKIGCIVVACAASPCRLGRGSSWSWMA